MKKGSNVQSPGSSLSKTHPKVTEADSFRDLSRVLFIRLSAIGDILLITPLIRIFHQQYPHAQIDILTKEAYAPLLQHHPLINHIITMPDSPTFTEVISTASKIRQQNYSKIFDLQTHWRTYLISLIVGLKNVARYRKYAVRRFLLVHFKINSYPKEMEFIPKRYFSAFRHLPLEWSPERLELFIPDDLMTGIEKKWPHSQDDLTIVVAPGAGRMTKRWPAEHFVELIGLLQNRLSAKIIMVGGKEDKIVCLEIEKEASHDLVNWCGETSLLETATILKKSRLVITNDTGVMHMAAAMQRKLIALFGPTVREFGFNPFMVDHRVIEHQTLNCRPCSYHGTDACPKGHFRCMKEIKPDQVFETALEFLGSAKEAMQMD